MKAILIIIAFLLSASSFAHNCSDNEDWECETKVEDRSGTHDQSRCRNSSNGIIACYETVKEICTEKNSGRSKSLTQTNYTGVCVSVYSQCW